MSKGKASGTGLIEGAITDGYLPSTADTSNPWIQLFKKIHDQYDKQAPFDGNVEYGMANAYTLVQALQAAGKNLTRQGVIDAINQQGAKWTGPGLVPFRYSQTDHGGYSGTQIGTSKTARSSSPAPRSPPPPTPAAQSPRPTPPSRRRRPTVSRPARGGWDPPSAASALSGLVPQAVGIEREVPQTGYPSPLRPANRLALGSQPPALWLN